MKKPLKIVLFFSHIFRELEEQVDKGESPRERLYGVDELRLRGAEIDIRDQRFKGFSGTIVSKLKQRGFNSISLSDVAAIFNADIVYVKDNFSILISLLCLIFRKRLVYCDSMFFIPKGRIKNMLTKLNLYLADTVISYSSTQRDRWIETYGKPAEKIEVHDFSIDSDFYSKFKKQRILKTKLNFLAIGRDPGREYGTLFSVIQKLESLTELAVVAPAYLTPKITKSNINVLHEVPYLKLFELYANADLSIVPIKKNIIYPSGIRAVLESIVLGRVVIAAKTDFLTEIFTDKENIIFFEPENEESLEEQIKWAINNSQEVSVISNNAKLLIESRFCFTKTTNRLADRIIGSN